MTLNRLTEIIAEASTATSVDVYKLAYLVQLDMLNVAKANTILSDSATDLYKDLLAYVREI